MMRTCVLGFFFLSMVAHGALTVRDTAKVTPVDKVIELLKRLSTQVTEEGKAEAEEYDKFECFCKEQKEQKTNRLARSQIKLEGLSAQIEDLDGQIALLTDDIQDLTKDASRLAKKINRYSKWLDKQHSSYLDMANQHMQAIEAIEHAIDEIKHGKEDQGLDLLEVRAMATRVLEVSKRASKVAPTDASLLNKLQELTKAGLSDDGDGGPVFEFHSNDILSTLEGLQLSWKKSKNELDEDETNVRNAFEKKKAGMLSEKKAAEDELSEKSGVEQSKSEDLHSAQEDQSSEKAAMRADESFMQELKDQCDTKAAEFEERSKTRADELHALSDTISQLEVGVKPHYDARPVLLQRTAFAGGHIKPGIPVRGPAPAPPTSFLQPRVQDRKSAEKKPASFIQLRGSSSRASAKVTHRVMDLLQAAGNRLRSPVLLTLAFKIKLSEDHFVKVRGLIKDLIDKLKDDADSEKDQKTLCDKDMPAAIDARDEARMTIENKAADISKQEAAKAQLEEEIDDLHKAIANNQKALSEATQLRSEESANYKRAINTGKQGAAAVQMAIASMADFYGSGVSLVQTAYVSANADRSGQTIDDLAPGTSYSGKYEGNKKEAEGIQGLLEVILSDFEATTNAAIDSDDASSQKYDQFKHETENDTDAKIAEVQTNAGHVADISDLLATLVDEKSDAEASLKDVLAELEALKPGCVDGEETYEERKAKREQEIAALKEAMQTLIDWQGA